MRAKRRTTPQELKKRQVRGFNLKKRSVTPQSMRQPKNPRMQKLVDMKVLEAGRSNSNRKRIIFMPMYSSQDDIYRRNGKAALKFAKNVRRRVQNGLRVEVTNPMNRSWSGLQKSKGTQNHCTARGKYELKIVSFDKHMAPMSAWASPGDICLNIPRRRDDLGIAGEVLVARCARSFPEDGRITWVLQQRDITVKQARSLRYKTERDGKKFFTWDKSERPDDFFVDGKRPDVVPDPVAELISVRKSIDKSRKMMKMLKEAA